MPVNFYLDNRPNKKGLCPSFSGLFSEAVIFIDYSSSTDIKLKDGNNVYGKVTCEGVGRKQKEVNRVGDLFGTR